VPGYWEAIRQRHIRTIKECDPRAVECSPAASRRLEANPHSVASMTRAALAQMDETGGPVVTWPPPNADCEVIPGAEWLCGPGRPRRVRVWSDDYVEDADERIRAWREPRRLENADDGRPTP
jgi:hypothetical protein